MSSNKLNNKKHVLSWVKELNEVLRYQDLASTPALLSKYFTNDCAFEATAPFEPMRGVEEFNNSFLHPLFHSFVHAEFCPYILIGGEYEGRECVSMTGNIIGTFENEWLHMKPTHQPTWLRFTTHFILEDQKIAHAWFVLDTLDIMRQAGYHFFPNRGVEWVPPAPMTADGILDYDSDDRESQKSIDLTNAMLDGLLSYDRKSLDSMGQERFWDVENMMWYGPSGIGTTKGLKGFQQNHQIPFLKAFPDRTVTQKTADRIDFCQLGDGNYSYDFGFPSMSASHTGDGWIGLSATGKQITMRVLDFWRREGDRLKENWVMIDMVDIFMQLGVDVLELIKEQNKK